MKLFINFFVICFTAFALLAEQPPKRHSPSIAELYDSANSALNIRSPVLFRGKGEQAIVILWDEYNLYEPIDNLVMRWVTQDKDKINTLECKIYTPVTFNLSPPKPPFFYLDINGCYYLYKQDQGTQSGIAEGDLSAFLMNKQLGLLIYNKKTAEYQKLYFEESGINDISDTSTFLTSIDQRDTSSLSTEEPLGLVTYVEGTIHNEFFYKYEDSAPYEASFRRDAGEDPGRSYFRVLSTAQSFSALTLYYKLFKNERVDAFQEDNIELKINNLPEDF